MRPPIRPLASSHRLLPFPAALALLSLGAPAAADWVTPNDPAFRRFPAEPHQENLFLLDMEAAWKLQKGSSDLTIAVIDLAFDVTHPDLQGKLWTDPEHPGVHGWDFVDEDATLDGPQAEHGNHVAGIIAAETNNGLGIAGMAPNCPLMLVKVGLPGCLTDGDLQARAIRYCVEKGARLVCMNHGLSELYPGWHVPLNGALKQACDEAYRKGVLIVTCTTSNDGAFYPATFPPAYDAVMGTGASDLWGRPSDMNGGSCFSEVIAPGGERSEGEHSRRSVYSCYAGDLEYNYYAGGCMATPHVVGLLALVLSHYPGIDVETARQIVRNTARGEAPGHQTRWGHGLIRPVAALSLSPEQIAARPLLVTGAEGAEAGVPTPCTLPSGEPGLAVSVRNDGVLDATVRVCLRRGAHTVAEKIAAALGLETTVVHLPVPEPEDAGGEAGDLVADLEDLGVCRPVVLEQAPDIRLEICDDDLAVREDGRGRRVLAVRVRNRGTEAAGRVAVILHQHEPAMEQRVGPPSRQLAAQVIAVPGEGAAVARFALEDLPTEEDLWAEIEALQVGAPHVDKRSGKARLRGHTATVPARPARAIARFELPLAPETEGVRLIPREGAATTPVEIGGRTALDGMPALRVEARVRWDEPLRKIEPLAYKWLAGGKSAAFGLAVLDGHPYCLLQTDTGGFVEVVCTDLTVTPGQWHTIELRYTGSTLTAALDGDQSAVGRPASGPVSRCPEPLRLGAAADKSGNLVSFVSGVLEWVAIGIPEVKGPDGRIPGSLRTGDVRRVLREGEEEVLRLRMSEERRCRIRLAVLEPGKGAVAATLGSPADVDARPLTFDRGRWSERLAPGEYELRLRAGERTVYTLDITGPQDVWQTLLRATDREGIGERSRRSGARPGPAPYTAWLATEAAGEAALELFDCTEGARMLLCPQGGAVQTVSQTGGVMGDSSVRSGGLGIWRRHGFAAGPQPTGAWLFVPSPINAAGDYALRGGFTLHWRRPDAGTQAACDASGTMRLLGLETRGGRCTSETRPTRYEEAIAAGLAFMEALTGERPGGPGIYERWYVDEDAPRVYWGCDGQMLCARTYYQAFMRGGDEHFRELALGIARRVIAHQNRDQASPRHGAIPYGFIGEKEEISWASSSNIQGKILYGLAQLASWSEEPDLLDALRLNADYCVRIQYPSGRWPHHLEKAPESLCGYDAAWNVAGLLIAWEKLGRGEYLAAAEGALAAYAGCLRPDGAIVCPCSHATPEEDDLAIRSSITMLTPFALALKLTGKGEYRRVLGDLGRFLSSRRHDSGVLKEPQSDCVNLIYAQNWGLQGLCEAAEATGDRRFSDMARSLADFFVRVQLVSADPHHHGAWVGSYNVAKDFPGGDMDDEGNAYDLYTSWGAGPIVYGLARLLDLPDSEP